MNIAVPKNWKKISSNNYKQLGITDNNFVTCVGSYFSQEDKPTIINFYDYSKNDSSFLEELHSYYDEIEEMNELIDGDPSDDDYESTAITRSLFHGFLNDAQDSTYLNVSKVLVNDGYNYVLQLFSKGNNGIYCLEMNLNDVNEKTVIQDIKKTRTVLEAIQVLKTLSNK